jgi:hypothetical protein
MVAPLSPTLSSSRKLIECGRAKQKRPDEILAAGALLRTGGHMQGPVAHRPGSLAVEREGGNIRDGGLLYWLADRR